MLCAARGFFPLIVESNGGMKILIGGGYICVVCIVFEVGRYGIGMEGSQQTKLSSFCSYIHCHRRMMNLTANIERVKKESKTNRQKNVMNEKYLPIHPHSHKYIIHKNTIIKTYNGCNNGLEKFLMRNETLRIWRICAAID